MTKSDREGILQVISDMSKDACGFRVRKDYAAMTDAELEAEYDYYASEIEAGIARDRAREEANKISWNAHIEGLMKIGAWDRATAIRWDMQAMDALDAEHYVYISGLPFDHVPGIETFLRVQDERRAAA